MDSAQLIQIKASAKHNVLVSALFGFALLLIAAALLSWLPKQFNLMGIFTASAGLVALVIAWFKFREPPHSVQLTPQRIEYSHRCGSWYLSWDNIQRIDVPRVQKGFEQKNLGMIGIKVKDYADLLEHISPRLMISILMEQRPLLLHAQDQSCQTGDCYTDGLIENDRYKTPDGRVFKGISGMFANRMARLRARLGYDLFISVAELDRSEVEFVRLLRQCHQHALSKNTP